MPPESVDCVVTSPPYWALRDYGMADQLGLEPTLEEYIEKLVQIFDEVKRVLKKTGTCWVNLGDTYYGGGRNKGNKNPKVKSKTIKSLKHSFGVPGPKGMAKCLAQIPARFAIAMTARGWILRNEIIWHKPNAMPSSVKDRFSVDFEKLFFFTKSKKYFFKQQFDPAKFDGRKQEIMRGSAKYQGKVTPGHAAHTFASRAHQRWQERDGVKVRNKRSVWSISTKPFKGAHFATFPELLVETPILAGCPAGGMVMDIFAGSGTTLAVAARTGREAIGIEINPEYIKIAEERLSQKNLFELQNLQRQFGGEIVE